ncbi:hypothetical protein V8E36_001865 [Tilletia maclaganii]
MASLLGSALIGAVNTTASSASTASSGPSGGAVGSGSGSKGFGTASIRPQERIPGFEDTDDPAQQQQHQYSIHTAARHGDLATIQHLLDSQLASAGERDEDGITPLHWAAINNHVHVCAFLLDRGAAIDALGGELVASPLQWAARSGHLNVTHLLLNRGADPRCSRTHKGSTLCSSRRTRRPSCRCSISFNTRLSKIRQQGSGPSRHRPRIQLPSISLTSKVTQP